MQITQKHYSTLDSTQTQAKREIINLRPDHCFLYTTDCQTAGYGQRARPWVSPPNINLYATYSFCLIKQTAYPILHNFPQVTAHAIATMLQELNFPITFKWVNDLLIQNKKVCGILCESSLIPGTDLLAIQLGIGLNVNMDQQHCNTIVQPATSLKLIAKKTFDKKILLQNITEKLMKNLEILLTTGFETFHQEINQLLAFKEQDIIFDPQTNNAPAYSAKLLGIDTTGAVLLQTGNTVNSYRTGRIMPPTKTSLPN